MAYQIPKSIALLNRIDRIDRIRGEWAAGSVLPPERLETLRETTRVHSVASSCRLSGIRVSDEEVRSLLGGQSCPLSEGRAVMGYAEAIGRTFPEDGPLVSTDAIRRLHAVLVSAPGNPPEASPWREMPLHVEAFDSNGRALGRIFQTLPPRHIPEKMDELTTWLELELRGRDHPPLLVIGTFVLVFLAASPFDHGNGRLGRALAVHLLRRAGYSHVTYASLERVLEEMRDEYHEALNVCETHLWTGEANLEPWLAMFLEAVRRQADRVAAKIGLERRSSEFTPLQRRIVETVREHGTARAALLMATLGTNRNTLKDNLRRLVDRSVLERIGKKRGSIYRLASGDPAPLVTEAPAGSRSDS